MSNFFFRLTRGTPPGFFLMAGPCVIETRDIALTIAENLKTTCEKLNIPLIFKASFDKANRTAVSSFRGPGFEKGLAVLEEVKHQLDLPVISDIHLPEQAAPAAQVLDVLQIPAFLCRQTDLILAAAGTGKPLSIKKGQFVSPHDCRNIIDKAHAAGNQDICITERGACFGYNNLVVDFRSIHILKEMGVPVVFDATHSVQLPGGGNGASAGERQFIPTLAKAAMAAGAHGLFMETHPNPDSALCDGPNSIHLDEMAGLLAVLLSIKQAADEPADNKGS